MDNEFTQLDGTGRPKSRPGELPDTGEYELTPVPTTSVALLVAATVMFVPLGLAALWYARKAKIETLPRATRLHYAARSRLLALYSFGAAFSLAVIAVVIAIFVMNDFRFTRDYFNPEYLVKSFPNVVGAFRTNLVASVVAFAASLIWGLAVALARGLPGPAAAPVRWLAITYIDVFRGLPILLTILIVGYGLPLTGLPLVRDMTTFTAGVIAITSLYGAYIADLFRSGIESVHNSQTMAARSLGLSHIQTMRHVVLPQAFVTIAPPLLGWYISVLKDTSLLSILGILEAVNVARIAVVNQNNLSAYTAVALSFLVVVIPLARLTDHLLARDAKKKAATG